MHSLYRRDSPKCLPPVYVNQIVIGVPGLVSPKAKEDKMDMPHIIRWHSCGGAAAVLPLIVQEFRT